MTNCSSLAPSAITAPSLVEGNIKEGLREEEVWEYDGENLEDDEAGK